MEAVKRAVETVDNCVKEVVDVALGLNYSVLITADHGNADYMINEDGTPNTAHTLNPVPLFLLNGKDHVKLSDGKLADLAPTILRIMGIESPKEMSGNILIDEMNDSTH
jgi:2,3-bisphosphoglycerate-independent phosphoglycerate mutase